jgi:hypothetical protein
VRGRTRDVTLLQLIHLLSSVGIDSVRVCPEPECGQLFYRVRRQLFCSKKCVNRANKREARKTAKTLSARARSSARQQPHSRRSGRKGKQASRHSTGRT